jgi:hypothetical protein
MEIIKLYERLGNTDEERAYWYAKLHRQFEGARWSREGKTFEWWLKRRMRLRRISRQRQKASKRR